MTDRRPDDLPTPAPGEPRAGTPRRSGAAGSGQLTPPVVANDPPPAPKGMPDPPAAADSVGRAWTEVLSGLGVGLVAIVGIQLVLGVAAGFMLDATNSGATGLPYRIGVPFGGLGTATALLLLVGLALQTAPAIAGRALSTRQKGLLRASVPVVSVLALVLVIGSVLAVVSQLNDYTVAGINASGYVRLQLATFLAGAIGISGVTIAAASAARKLC